MRPSRCPPRRGQMAISTASRKTSVGTRLDAYPVDHVMREDAEDEGAADPAGVDLPGDSDETRLAFTPELTASDIS
jgi:hypothetical protein